MRDREAIAIRRLDRLALLVLAAVVLPLAYMLVWRPLAATRLAAAEQAGLAEKLNALTASADAVGEGRALLQRLETEIAEVDRRLPADTDFPGFYAALTQCASTHNVTLLEVLPGEPVVRGDYVEMPVVVSAASGFEDFHAFFFGVTTLPRLTKVSQLTVSASPKPTVCNTRFVVNIFAARKAEKNHGA